MHLAALCDTHQAALYSMRATPCFYFTQLFKGKWSIALADQVGGLKSAL